MAIEFHCPYCTALIRVGDAAAGRQGVCPKCETRLVVPSPRRETVSETGSVADDPSEISGFDPEQLPSPVIQSRLRQRRTSRSPLLPLACGGILLLVTLGAWIFYDPTLLQEELTGEINASVVDSQRLSSRAIGGELVPESEEAYRDLAGSLTEVTGRVRSQWMVVEFSEAAGQVIVQLEVRRGQRLIRVSLSSTPGLQAFADAQSGRLDQLRREALAGEFSRLLDRWESKRQRDEPFEAWPEFRDSVGLTALSGGLGYHVVAVVGRQEHRCVFEADGALFFILPTTVGEFELIGRKMADGSIPFPANFTVSLPPPAP